MSANKSKYDTIRLLVLRIWAKEKIKIVYKMKKMAKCTG